MKWSQVRIKLPRWKCKVTSQLNHTCCSTKQNLYYRRLLLKLDIQIGGTIYRLFLAMNEAEAWRGWVAVHKLCWMQTSTTRWLCGCLSSFNSRSLCPYLCQCCCLSIYAESLTKIFASIWLQTFFLICCGCLTAAVNCEAVKRGECLKRFFSRNVSLKRMCEWIQITREGKSSCREQRYWKKSFLGTSTFDIASSINMKQLFGFYKWAIPGLFFFNCVFSIHLIMHIGKFCQWLDSIRGSLVLKVTALPTGPQPLPINC